MRIALDVSMHPYFLRERIDIDLFLQDKWNYNYLESTLPVQYSEELSKKSSWNDWVLRSFWSFCFFELCTDPMPFLNLA